jgi:hypothetical protein
MPVLHRVDKLYDGRSTKIEDEACDGRDCSGDPVVSYYEGRLGSLHDQKKV